MPKSEEDRIRDEMNQRMWHASSDELRQLKIDLYQKGQSDGSDLPRNVRRTARAGGVFGKLVGAVLIIGAGYLLISLGPWLMHAARSLF